MSINILSRFDKAVLYQLQRNEIMILESQRFLGASRNGQSLKTYDDGFGPLWISRNSMGICGIVRARTWSDAYGICQDEFFHEASDTISEMMKEYGYREINAKVDPQLFSDDVWMEAYGFRPNGPNVTDKVGHGIYNKDMSAEALDPLTPDLAEALDILLELKEEEE